MNSLIWPSHLGSVTEYCSLISTGGPWHQESRDCASWIETRCVLGVSKLLLEASDMEKWPRTDHGHASLLFQSMWLRVTGPAAGQSAGCSCLVQAVVWQPVGRGA